VLEQKSRWSYSHTVLALCWFGWIAIYLCRSVLAPILPVVSGELGLSHAQAGMLETAYLLGYIVIKMPAGVLGNRIGIKRTLTLGMVGYALATALNFLATGFLHLFVLRFLVGLFQGVHLPLANTLLSERFGDRQGRAIGFHESGPNVGNSIAYPLTVAIASSWGWRYAFLLLSLPAFVLAGVVTLILKDERQGSMGGTRASECTSASWPPSPSLMQSTTSASGLSSPSPLPTSWSTGGWGSPRRGSSRC
jgi:MFS family permease